GDEGHGAADGGRDAETQGRAAPGRGGRDRPGTLPREPFMSETPGTLIGISNAVTRARARVPQGLDPDSNAALYERLRTHAARAIEGRESYIHDAVVLGKRVRLFSNSHHLADFWRENWPTEAEWRESTGQVVSREPALVVHAMINVSGEPEAAYVSVARQEVFLFNTSYYGDLRGCTM